MSARKNLRKRTSHANKNSESTPQKKIKSEQEEVTVEMVEETKQTKQPIIAPNGKIFYPCQYCNKIFPQKITNITHMKKCPNKISVVSTENTPENKNINNNSHDQSKESENEKVNGSDGNIESKSAAAKIKISQNITVREAESEKRLHKHIVDPSSIYDYDEEDDDKPEVKYKKNDEDASNNRLCKQCKTLFENPLDLLRHTRDCHNFPRTILPPEEIEKYFDSPNRDYCPICEKPIKTRNFRSIFIKHLLVHTTGLTHECSICKQKFRRRDHMRAHEKRHIVSV